MFIYLFLKPITAFLKDFIYIFLEWGGGREKEKEKNIDGLPPALPQPGTWPPTQACALTRNSTSDVSVCRTMPTHWPIPVRVLICHFKEMFGSGIFPLLAAELHLKPEFPGKVLKFLTSLRVKLFSDTSYIWLKNIHYIYILYCVHTWHMYV